MTAWAYFLQKRPFFPLLLGLLLGILTKTDGSIWIAALPINLFFGKIIFCKKEETPLSTRCLFPLLIFLCFAFGFIHSSTTLLQERRLGTLYFHSSSSFKGKKVKVYPYKFVEKEGTVHKYLSHLPMLLTAKKEFSGPPGFYAAKATLSKRSKKWIAQADWVEFLQESSLHKFREALMHSLVEKTNRYTDEKSASFLISLFTGLPLKEEIDQAFTLLGLKHIVAISGFHLSLIASFLLLFSSFLRSINLRYGLSVCALFIYLLFLGVTPSLFRSYFMFTGLAGSIFFRKNFDTLNNFFAVLFFQLALDPYSLYNIGFQFSYLITFALLSLYPFLSDFFSVFFPPQAEGKNTISEKYLYLFERFFFHACCLQLAVLLPGAYLSLYYFQLFNITGLLYNLVIPLAAALCLFFYTLGVLFIFVEPLFAFFINCAGFAAKSIVHLTTHAPFLSFLCIQCPLSKLACLLLSFLFVTACLAAFIKREQKNVKNSC